MTDDRDGPYPLEGLVSYLPLGRQVKISTTLLAGNY
jgi:hypothetical protein